MCLVDIGGGTTDIAIFTEGAIRHTAVIPIAGDQVTNDIAMALRTRPSTPKRSRSVTPAPLPTGRCRRNHQGAERGRPSTARLSRQALAEVVEPRYDELFTLIQVELRRSGYEDLIPAGIGADRWHLRRWKAVELAEEIFHAGSPGCAPWRQRPGDVVRNPIYSTGVGLLCTGCKSRPTAFRRGPSIRDSYRGDEEESRLFERLQAWVKAISNDLPQHRTTLQRRSRRKTREMKGEGNVRTQTTSPQARSSKLSVLVVAAATLSTIWSRATSKALIICANTDAQALKSIGARTILQLGTA